MIRWLGQVALSIAAVRGVNKLTNAERYKLVQVAEAVGADPDLLAAVISLETGGTFDPSIPNQGCLRRTGNPDVCATGLIQFTKDTAELLGTSPMALRVMSVCEQLDFVQMFYKRVARGGIRIRGDEYVAVFMPDFLGASNDEVVLVRGEPFRGRSGTGRPISGVYEANSGLDMDGDGVITVGELRRNVLNRVPSGRIDITPEPCVSAPLRGGAGGLFPALAIAGVAVALFWGTLQPAALKLIGR